MINQPDKSKEELISELEKLQQKHNSLKAVFDTGLAESKHVKEHFKKKHANFLKIFAAAPVGLLLLDKNTFITRVNKTAAKMVLRDPVELIGKLVGSGLECVHSLESPKGCGFGLNCPECPLRQAVESALAGGQSVHGIEINITLCIGGKSRERWLKVNTGPIEIDGKQLVIVAIDDITDHKQAEIAQRENQEKYRLIFEYSPLGLLSFDEKGVIVACNDNFVRIIGSTRGALVGLNMCNLPDKKMVSAIQEALIGSTGSYEGVYHSVTSDKISPVRVLYAPIDIGHGHIHGGVGIIEDITTRRQVEEELEESREKYRGLSDAAFESIFFSEKDICIEQNLMAEKMFGYTPEEAVGMAGTEWITVEYREMVMNNILTGYEEPYEAVALRKDGTTFPCMLRGKMMHYKGRNVSVTSLSDITYRKRAEQALRESEEKFRTVADFTYDWEYWEGKDGQIIYISPSCERISGYEPEAFLSDSRLLEKIVHPDDAKLMKGHVRKVRSSEYLHEIEELDYRIIKKDGTIAHIGHLCRPVFDDKGIYLGRRISNRDITERKRTQEILLESEERYRIITQNTLDIIFMLDKTGKILFINESIEKTLGYKQEEIIGKSFTRFVPKSEFPKYFLQLKNVFLNKEIFNFITKIYHKNKDIVDIEINGKLVRYEGKLVALGTMRNISERIKAELTINQQNEELIKANAEKDKFFSIIAHDLRGPIGGFMGLTERMDEGMKDLTWDQLQEMVRIMKKSASNLYSLLGNLLEWSRMQRGLIPFEPFSFLLIPKIIEIIQSAIDAASKKEITITHRIPDDMEVFADENMFASIIRNLVGNAVKFTPKGGKISVSARSKSKDFVEISIKDTGIGMNQHMIDNLFSLDINTSRIGTKGESSTGLGLIICKDFIEKHNGTLHIDSAIGKGSTFSFTNPGRIKAENKAENNTSGSVDMSSGPGRKLNILIAEDDETSDLLISIALNKISREFYHAKTGFEAIEICHSHPDIDLILMDIQMPEMDGYEATRRIRLFNKDVVIIAQTAYIYSNDREMSTEAGCNDYITKPISQVELMELIRKHIR